MSHVYQNCQRANGLAWTGWMKNQNIVAMHTFFKKFVGILGFYTARQLKKTWQIMWRKRIFKRQPSKLLWVWIFGAVTKVRTLTEKNHYLDRLLWRCLKPPAGFAERAQKRSYTGASTAVVNGCIACICSWLLWFISFMSNKQAASYLSASDSASSFAIMKKHLSSFVGGQGTIVPCIFMRFLINFQTSSCGFFVCLFSFPMKLHFLVF